MDWGSIIDGKREALLRVVDMLLSIAGLDNLPVVAKIPRGTRGYILRILRPAESALRRLIVIAARDLADIRRPVGVFMYGLDPNAPAGRRPVKGGAGVARPCLFPLLDPLKRFSFRPARRYSRTVPRVTILGLTDPRPLPPAPTPDDMVDAARLCGRLQALRRALDDIDGQARRLARWQVRRDGEGAGSIPRRSSPLRLGPPPGRRKRAVHEIDPILRDCHALALRALSPADTP